MENNGCSNIVTIFLILVIIGMFPALIPVLVFVGFFGFLYWLASLFK